MTRVSGVVKNDALIQASVRALRRARHVSGLFARLNRITAQWKVPPVSCGVLALRLLTFPPLLPALALLHQRPALIFELFHALCADPESRVQRATRAVPELAVPG